MEAFREFDKYQGNMDIKEFNRMIGNYKDKYIKLQELEERDSIVENEI